MPEQVHCRECRHYERVNGRIVEARCTMTNISFTKFRYDIAPIDPRTFYCAYAQERGAGIARERKEKSDA